MPKTNYIPTAGAMTWRLQASETFQKKLGSKLFRKRLYSAIVMAGGNMYASDELDWWEARVSLGSNGAFSVPVKGQKTNSPARVLRIAENVLKKTYGRLHGRVVSISRFDGDPDSMEMRFKVKQLKNGDIEIVESYV